MVQVLLCTLRWTQDGKLNRFFKMTIGLCVMFLAARSPVDILQFRDIIHSSQVPTSLPYFGVKLSSKVT